MADDEGSVSRAGPKRSINISAGVAGEQKDKLVLKTKPGVVINSPPVESEESARAKEDMRRKNAALKAEAAEKRRLAEEQAKEDANKPDKKKAKGEDAIAEARARRMMAEAKERQETKKADPHAYRNVQFVPEVTPQTAFIAGAIAGVSGTLFLQRLFGVKAVAAVAAAASNGAADPAAGVGVGDD